MKIIITKGCKQCLQPFQFISRREGRRGSHRVFCEVCRELRTDEATSRFKDRQSEADKRAAIRDNAIRCHEGSTTMSNQNRKGTGKKAFVRAAALSGYCNTTLDLADETSLTVQECSSYVAAMIRRGELRRTERRLPNKSADGRGRKLHVFEVVA